MRFAIPLSIIAAGLVAGSGALTASAADSPKSDRACFTTNQVYNWRLLAQDKGIVLRTDGKDVYSATFDAVCPNIEPRLTIGVQTKAGSGLFICEGDDAYLRFRSVTGDQKCDLRKFHKLSAGEIAGLSKDETP
jgi:hypothetical protein